MFHKLAPLADKFGPSLIGGGGLTLANITPDPNDISQWSQAAIAVVTVLIQIIHLFKRKK